MSAMILVHQDENRRTSVVKFAYADGQLSGVVEQMADYIHANTLTDSLWENIAGDRQRVVLEQQNTIRQLDAKIQDMKQWDSMVGYPSKEMVT